MLFVENNLSESVFLPKYYNSKLNINKQQKQLKWAKLIKTNQRVYQKLIMPLFQLQRVLGKAPFYIDDTGKMKFKLLSIVTVYSVIFHIITMIFSILSIHNIIISWNKTDTFKDYINLILTVSLITPSIISPVISWIECPLTIRYLNNWEIFEERYKIVIQRTFPRTSDLRPNYLKLAVYICCMIFMELIVIPYRFRQYLHWSHIFAYLVSITGNILHFTYWILSSNIISNVAKKMRFYGEKQLLDTENYDFAKVEDYRLLWMLFTQIIHQFGSSSCGDVILFTISFIIYLSCTIFCFIFDFFDIILQGKFVELNDDIMVGLFIWILLKDYCYAGSQITETCIKGSIENIHEIKKYQSLSWDEELQINIIFYMMRNFVPKTTIAQYFVIDKGLHARLLFSIILTYIIVLIQFQEYKNKSSTG